MDEPTCWSKFINMLSTHVLLYTSCALVARRSDFWGTSSHKLPQGSRSRKGNGGMAHLGVILGPEAVDSGWFSVTVPCPKIAPLKRLNHWMTTDISIPGWLIHGLFHLAFTWQTLHCRKKWWTYFSTSQLDIFLTKINKGHQRTNRISTTVRNKHGTIWKSWTCHHNMDCLPAFLEVFASWAMPSML